MTAASICCRPARRDVRLAATVCAVVHPPHDRPAPAFAPRCWPRAALGRRPRDDSRAARRRLAGHSGLHPADRSARHGRARSCIEAALADLRPDELGGLRLAGGAGGARRLRPPRRGPLFRRRPDDPARAGGDEPVVPLASRLLRDLFDVGLELGQSVRTPRQACQLARAGRHDLHVAGRVALSGRQRRSCSTRSSIASAADAGVARQSAVHGDRRGPPQRAAAIRRNGVSARAERQALARRPARPATAALAGLCPLRHGRSRRPCSCSARITQERPARAPRAPASSCCGCATSCTFTPASRTTCSIAPSKCGWPSSTATRAPRRILPVEQFMSEYFRHTSAVQQRGQQLRGQRRARAMRWSSCWSARCSAIRSKATSASRRDRSWPRRAAWPSCKAT